MRPGKPSRFLRLMSHQNTVKGNGFIGVGGVRLHTRQILASVGHLLPVLHPCKQYPTKHGQGTLLPCLHLWMRFFCPGCWYSSALPIYPGFMYLYALLTPLDAVSYCPAYTPGCSILLPCLYPWMQYPIAPPLPPGWARVTDSLAV